MAPAEAGLATRRADVCGFEVFSGGADGGRLDGALVVVGGTAVDMVRILRPSKEDALRDAGIIAGRVAAPGTRRAGM